jgi:signal transduction histidine kinase
VFVACRRRGSEVRLEVRDSGIGIPGDELGKVFRAFLQADATRSKGLALGLFIVKRAADFLGHSVQVCSAVGFVGQLPRGILDPSQLCLRRAAVEDWGEHIVRAADHLQWRAQVVAGHRQ